MLRPIELRRLLRDRRGVAAVIVAVTLPATLLAVAVAAEVAFMEVQRARLQAAADAAAGAGRQALNPYLAGAQGSAVTEARRYANGNVPSSLAASDVVQGWWDIKNQTFGPSTAGQTGEWFNNAVRVTTRLNHRNVTGGLLFPTTMALSKRSTGYKCSNTDYPLTLIPDDPIPPQHPTVWLSWADDGYRAGTSYYFANPSGRRNPVIKFFSPTDGEDVSFVVTFSNGSTLQMDTYCKGTYLIVPDAFNWNDNANISATVKRGSTNNSFAVFPNQQNYPTFVIGKWGATGVPAQKISYLRPDRVHVTPYPSSNGIQYWASEGNPTPDRRTILVQQSSDF